MCFFLPPQPAGCQTPPRRQSAAGRGLSSARRAATCCARASSRAAVVCVCCVCVVVPDCARAVRYEPTARERSGTRAKLLYTMARRAGSGSPPRPPRPPRRTPTRRTPMELAQSGDELWKVEVWGRRQQAAAQGAAAAVPPTGQPWAAGALLSRLPATCSAAAGRLRQLSPARAARFSEMKSHHFSTRHL